MTVRDRRDIDLDPLRRERQFSRLPRSVPHAIDDRRRREGARGQIRQGLCAADQRLARPAMRCPRPRPGSGQLRWAVAVDLHPEDVEVINRGKDLPEPTRAKVEVQVEEDDTSSPVLAERRDVIHEMAEQTPVRDEARSSGLPNTRHPSFEPAGTLAKQVGLERAESSLADFTTEFDETVTVRDGVAVVRRPRDAPRRGVTPVHPHVVTHLATEKHMTRNTETTGLGIGGRYSIAPMAWLTTPALTRTSRGLQSKHDVLVTVDRVADERGCDDLTIIATPGEPNPSSNSLQPTLPSASQTLTKL